MVIQAQLQFIALYWGSAIDKALALRLFGVPYFLMPVHTLRNYFLFLKSKRCKLSLAFEGEKIYFALKCVGQTFEIIPRYWILFKMIVLERYRQGSL